MERLQAKLAAIKAQHSTAAITNQEVGLHTVQLRDYQLAGIAWLLHRRAFVSDHVWRIL